MAVLVCGAASAVTLFAGTRGWDSSGGGVTAAGAREPGTGGAVAPWLPALALVSLAGAGALVALRSAARTALGWLLGACGCGILVTGGYAVVDHDRPLWPVVACCCGGAISWVGWRTVRGSAAWPAMGGRFERAEPPDEQITKWSDEKEMWDALDRGEDPTQ